MSDNPSITELMDTLHYRAVLSAETRAQAYTRLKAIEFTVASWRADLFAGRNTKVAS